MIPEKAIKPIIKNGRDNTELAAGSLIAYGVFPDTQEGIQKAKDTIAVNDNWLVPSLLPNYYDGIDSDIIGRKETAGIIFIRNALKEFYKLSAGTQDFVDTSVTKEETIAPPKLPPAHYIQGQKARWEPEFENEIDHAVYFAGKSPLPKGAKQREVLDWLKSLGLTYKQIHDHREKVLEQMRETISVPGVEEEYPYVYIDAVDQDFVIEDDKEYDDEEDTEEYDYDLYGSNLDNLLDVINEDEKKDQDQDQKQVIENIEEEIVQASDDEDDEEGHIGSEDDIPDELLQDEVDPKLLEKLLVTINKPKKESSYTSNKKIFDSIVVNFGRLQSTLDTINNNLEKQNSLIKANIDTQLAIGELVSNQTDLLGEKFDAILKEFQKQSDIAKDIADDEKRKAAEDSLEGQRDSAGTRDIDDLTKGGGKSKRGSKIADYYKQKALRRLYRAMPKRLRGGIRKVRKIKQRENKIEKYLKSKLTRKLYRKLPKSVRNARQKVRKLQRLPGKAKAKATSKITSMLPTKGKQAVSAISKIRGAGSVGRLAGPARYAFAGLEYGERKAEGQSEVQALSGVGGGLAGAAAGGAAGAKGGAAIGGAIGLAFAGVGAGPGALIGGIIGGLLGSIGGGIAGSGIADTITGAHETGGLTKPGTALLHGTEAVINPNAMSQSSLISDVGGMFIGATTGYLNAVGPMAASISPTIKGISAQMARQYDVPTTLTQTNVGGSLPNLSGELKKVKEKGKQTTGEELSGIEKDLLETQDPQSFADKLMKMLDPEGKFQELLKTINNPNSIPPGGEMDLNLIGDGAFDTGLRTGPSGVIGGSDDYHQDLSFGPNVSMEDKRKLILQMAVAYDRVGRKMELSNDRVRGKVFPVNGTNEEQIKWIVDAEAAHRARNGGTGRNAIDFYTPVKSENRFGSSVENAPMLAPVIEGAETRYSSGGGAGAGMSMVKDGVKILELIHGRTDIALPKGGRIPSTIAKPTTQPSSPQQTISGKIIRSFKVGNFVYTEREGGVYTQNGKPISKELFDAVVKNHSSVAQASVSPPQQPSQNLTSSISAPPQRQRTVERTMEIASLSYDNTEQSNGMMIINNQQPSMPPMPAGSPAIPYSNAGRSSSELLKDLMLQRLNA